MKLCDQRYVQNIYFTTQFKEKKELTCVYYLYYTFIIIYYTPKQIWPKRKLLPIKKYVKRGRSLQVDLYIYIYICIYIYIYI